MGLSREERLPDNTSSSIAAAAGWVAQLMTGTLATMLTLVAAALVGFALLRGDLSLRRGTSVVLGSFVLFGAPLIAAALLQLAGQASGTRPVSAANGQITALAPAMPAPVDPYAGAAMSQ